MNKIYKYKYQLFYSIFNFFLLAYIYKMVFTDSNSIVFKRRSNILEIILFLIISLIASVSIKESYNYIKSLLMKNKIIIGLFLLYVSFALSGNRLFLYPIQRKVKIIDVISFIIVVIYLLPIVLFAFSKMDKYIKNFSIDRKKRTNKETKFIFLFCFIFIMFVGCIYLYAFNPAVSSPDTTSQVLQAKKITEIIDWQSPLHTLIIRFFLNLYDSITTIAIVHCTYYSLIIAYAISFLYKLGLPLKESVFICVIIASMPNNAISSITVLQDIPYSVSILWATLIISKVLLSPESYSKKINVYIESYIVMVLICLLKKNGFVPCIFFTITLLFVLKFNLKSKILLLTFLISLIIYKGPFFNYFNVQQPPGKLIGAKYIALSYDIVGVWKNHGDINQDAFEIIEAIRLNPPSGDFFENYPNHYPYRYLWSSMETKLDISIMKFIELYIDTFLHNSNLMTKIILLRNHTLFGLMHGVDEIINQEFYTNDNIKDENWIYPTRDKNNLTYSLTMVGQLSFLYPMRYFIWQIGVFIVVILFCSIVLRINQIEKYYLIIMPIIGQISSLVLGSAWNDYRYYWSISLCSIYFLLLSLIIIKRKDINLLSTEVKT